MLQSLLSLKEERIRDMEEALRESVKITAQREMVVHDLEVKVKRTEIQVSFLRTYLLLQYLETFIFS